MGTSKTSTNPTPSAALADNVVPLEGEPIAALHQLAIALAGNADLDMLLRQALLIAAHLTDSSHATILLLDERGERIRARATLDSDNVAPLEMVGGPMMRRGLAGWVARERRTALVRDTEQDPRWLPGPGLGDLRSAIVAPLLLDDVVLGLLTLGHSAPDHYDNLHAQLAEIIGALLIAAIRRSQASAPGHLEAPHASRGVLARPSPSIQQIIVASQDRISQKLALSLPGLVLHHLPVPPPVVPRARGTTYFQLSAQGNDWEAIREAKNIAIQLPPRYRGLKLELLSLEGNR